MRKALTLLGIAVAVLVSGAILLGLFQRRLIYIPFDQRVPPAATVSASAEDVEFETADGLRLRAWFVPAAGPSPRGTVLVFHGNAGSRVSRTPLAEALARHGYAALLVDYRGYGGNPGRPNERGLLADARAALGYAESRGDVDGDRLVYFGESLGTGVAVALAAERPPAAMILRSPFTSLTDVARVHYPFLPVGLLLLDRFESRERIAGVGCPTLVIVGGRDSIVPAALSRELFEAIPGSGNELLVIEDADHNDYDLLAGDRMIGGMAAFLARSIDGPARADAEER
jgi:fermentation-respiration switch protein FrsA (DUF1100 family)